MFLALGKDARQTGPKDGRKSAYHVTGSHRGRTLTLWSRAERDLMPDTHENEKLVGTWKLVSALGTSSSGERDQVPYGSGPEGVLTYGADGRVTALISYGGRKPLSVQAAAEEQAAAFKTFFAYSGTYTLSADKVVHKIEISSIQNYVGKDLVRTVKFEGNRITLVTPPALVNGKVQTIELKWQRVAY